MTRKSSTKRSLMLSFLSLVLCIAMLLGTTYAWFTDSVTSGRNTIKAGNLDIEVQYSKDFSTFKTLEGATELFSDVSLWEPGATSVVYLKIKNAGTLALKYKFGINVLSETIGINVDDEEFKLSDIIQFGVKDGVTEKYAERSDAIGAISEWKALSAGYSTAKNLASGEQTVALVLNLPETVGNEANYMTGTVAPQIELGLNVVATQLEAESDSFGNDYDEEADIDLPTIIPEFKYAEHITVKDDGTLKEPVVLKNKEGTFKAEVPEGTKVLEGAEELSLSVTPITAADLPNGVNVEVSDPMLETPVYYDIDIAGLDDETNDKPISVSIFVGTGYVKEMIKVYHKGNPVTPIEYNTESGIVSFASATFSPFEIIVSDGKYHIRSVEDFKAFAANVNGGNTYAKKTVVLDANLDLNNEEWAPIGTSAHPFSGTFDGKNHTISNLKISKGTENTSGNNNIGLFGQVKYPEGSTGAIKNIKINNADVTGSLYVGIIAGNVFDQANSTISGIEITGNVKVKGYWYIGSVVGGLYIGNFKDVTVNANEGSYVTSTEESGNIGGIIGFTGEMNYATYYENININNVDVSGSYYIGGIIGTLHQYCILRNSTISNATIKGEELVDEFAGRKVGAPLGSVDTETCTATNVTASIVVTVADEASLRAALTSASANEIIRISSNMDISSTLTVDKAVTLDLNEKTITLLNNATDGQNRILLSAAATLKNGTVTRADDNKVGPMIETTANGALLKDLTVDGKNIEVTNFNAYDKSYPNDSKNGYGIFIKGGTTVDGCIIKNVNAAADYPGGTPADPTKNEKGTGAGITAYACGVTIKDTQIIDCVAKGGGAAINFYANGGGSLTLEGNCKFNNNTAGGSGGAVYLQKVGSVKIGSDVEMSGNTANGGGGALYMNECCGCVIKGTYKNNKTEGSLGDNGGAFYIMTNDASADPIVYIEDAWFEGNVSAMGGTVYSNSPSSKTNVGIVISNTTFKNNIALGTPAAGTLKDGGGAAFYASRGYIIFNSGLVDGNVSSGFEGHNDNAIIASNAGNGKGSLADNKNGVIIINGGTINGSMAVGQKAGADAKYRDGDSDYVGKIIDNR